MMRTSPRSIRLAHPWASGPGPEPDEARLVDHPVAHSQACDITSGFARSLKLSAKRTRSPGLTLESGTAASWASLRRTYSLRDRPNLRARASSTATTSSGTSRISMSASTTSHRYPMMSRNGTAGRPANGNASHGYTRPERPRRRRPAQIPGRSSFGSAESARLERGRGRPRPEVDFRSPRQWVGRRRPTGPPRRAALRTVPRQRSRRPPGPGSALERPQRGIKRRGTCPEL